jgi:hypothetical protein
MNRALAILAGVIAAFVFTCQGADAHWRKHHFDKRLVAVSVGVGAASTATYLSINQWNVNHWNATSITQFGAYAGTAIGCMAVSPIVATVVVNRPLTMREAHVLVASCVLPIVGGWLVNEAYNAHPEWEAGSAPPVVKHRRKRHAKM